MSKIAYAIFDLTEQKLHQFVASKDVLAKDAVAAYLERVVIPDSFKDGIDNQDAKDMLSQISATSGPEQLVEILVAWDMEFSMIPV